MSVKKWILAFLLIGCLIFTFSPSLGALFNATSIWDVREQIVFLTGVCAISLMVLSVITSARFAVVNKMAGGLDKAYSIHKWAGIYAFVFSLLHWLTEKSAGWLIDLNIIAHPGKLGDSSQFSQFEIVLFRTGVLLAEISFYLIVILIILSLTKKVPYYFFRKIHKAFPVIFLVLAFHAVTAQLKENWLSSPAGYVLLLLIAVGCGAACWGLFQKIGRSRQVKSVVKAYDIQQNGMLKIDLQILAPWFNYQPGQYVFLTFSHNEEPHPFSIASFEADSRNLRFVIKEQGDFTRDLKNYIKVGQYVRIEGPYGEFTFNDRCERQIWIAGGIGIAPFLAKLEALARLENNEKTIDFWYCTSGCPFEHYPVSLPELCQRARVKLHHIDTIRQARLTVADIVKEVSNIEKVSIWFCGSQQFSASLQADLKQHRFDSRYFHYDRFNMR